MPTATPFSHKLPLLRCKPLPCFSIDDWSEIRQAFAEMTACELGQGWRENVEPAFLPATVSVGWQQEQGTQKSLWIYADMSDLDIRNAATARNQRTWELGDVFEIFLEPRAGQSYFEFHVTPENQVVECEFTLPRVPKSPLLFLEQPLIQSWTKVSEGRWEALAQVPLNRLGPPDTTHWKFSLSRYDATRGQKPVLSSSSPHQRVNFHRREEWGDLILHESF